MIRPRRRAPHRPPQVKPVSDDDDADGPGIQDSDTYITGLQAAGRHTEALAFARWRSEEVQLWNGPGSREMLLLAWRTAISLNAVDNDSNRAADMLSLALEEASLARGVQHLDFIEASARLAPMLLNLGAMVMARDVCALALRLGNGRVDPRMMYDTVIHMSLALLGLGHLKRAVRHAERAVAEWSSRYPLNDDGLPRAKAIIQWMRVTVEATKAGLEPPPLKI